MVGFKSNIRLLFWTGYDLIHRFAYHTGQGTALDNPLREMCQAELVIRSDFRYKIVQGIRRIYTGSRQCIDIIAFFWEKTCIYAGKFVSVFGQQTGKSP